MEYSIDNNMEYYSLIRQVAVVGNMIQNEAQTQLSLAALGEIVLMLEVQ